MKFLGRKYYSGYCSYEVEANNQEQACEMVEKMPVNCDEVLATLEDWKECNEIEALPNK